MDEETVEGLKARLKAATIKEAQDRAEHWTNAIEHDLERLKANRKALARAKADLKKAEAM
jgi:hypothetical protein